MEMLVRRFVATSVGLLVAAAIQPSAVALAQPEATLEGRAVLPADTFAEGPSSGADLEDETKGGREPPFEGQPVGGISAVLDAGEGKYKAMPDNGFGKKGNSSDFLLRVYSIRPDFETADGGSGEISYGEFVQLRDPDRWIPFEITNENSEDRLLTGADFDIESVRQDPQGDLWLGDEFGPFLLHTDATGRVLEAPIPLPDVKSPENPTLEEGEEPTLATSKGFEGMALSTDGGTLYPMLEGALEEDEDQRQRFIYEFDLGSRSYTGERWRYHTEEPEYSIGDLTALDDGRFLVIERDNEQGEEAHFKKVYLVDLARTASEGFLVKREVLDLLSIRDPGQISSPEREGDIGLGDPFSFPFQTIESILSLRDGRLLLLNDNNYPLSAGRNPDQPDDTETIIVRADALLDSSPARQMPDTGGLSLLLPFGLALLITGALGIIALRGARFSWERAVGRGERL
jgi:hypothetical protein